MFVYPAIDLIDQKCVRLSKGVYTEKSVYDDDPVNMAKKLVSEGAKRLHIIDLDAAIKSSDCNYKIIEEIRKAVDVPMQVGGGIRSIQRARELIEIGIERIIVSTAVVTNPDFFDELMSKYSDNTAVSVDTREETVLIRGWVKETDLNIYDFSEELYNKGLKTIIYTDTERDGMLRGPNFEILDKLNKKLDLNLIAAGGVTTVEDLNKLAEMNLYGAIIGKALYENQISMKDIKAFQERIKDE
ncbi:MAG: 1-(5-phosphoribosyl)-5-[(5-phosphoribosylamino)methylideneamino]imidazole-4-carboxamide isomerase [Tissierellia bacterium]|nr:1-(5-phosphoribosyl)-5-[(5-phosphoribosylamino)methylideneamino]imidazole-4-carboxamide isomerase [Tissierellia bacterium]